jgi:hypothetical protein
VGRIYIIVPMERGKHGDVMRGWWGRNFFLDISRSRLPVYVQLESTIISSQEAERRDKINSKPLYGYCEENLKSDQQSSVCFPFTSSPRCRD